VGTGIDFSEGLDQSHPMNLCRMITGGGGWEEFTQEQFGKQSYVACRHFGKSVEEFFEMFGMTLIWVAFLHHVASRYREVHVRLRPPTRPT
jgi:hypothetical protein